MSTGLSIAPQAFRIGDRDLNTGGWGRAVTLDAVRGGQSVLMQGMGGESVAQVQRALADRGFQVEVDGKLGVATAGAIREFQVAHNLRPDGIVGRETLARLIPAQAPNPQPAAAGTPPANTSPRGAQPGGAPAAGGEPGVTPPAGPQPPASAETPAPDGLELDAPTVPADTRPPLRLEARRWPAITDRSITNGERAEMSVESTRGLAELTRLEQQLGRLSPEREREARALMDDLRGMYNTMTSWWYGAATDARRQRDLGRTQSIERLLDGVVSGSPPQ